MLLRNLSSGTIAGYTKQQGFSTMVALIMKFLNSNPYDSEGGLSQEEFALFYRKFFEADGVGGFATRLRCRPQSAGERSPGPQTKTTHIDMAWC